jgi:hypothetical protein
MTTRLSGFCRTSGTLPARVSHTGRGPRNGRDFPAAEATAASPGGWLASAQRFPVDLAFKAADGPPRGVRYNARASVIFYTGEHPVFDALAWLWIRLISVLTFVS